MRRPGLWVTNGHPGNPAQMLSWRPGALTCYYDYLGVNGVFGYKAANPAAKIIVRFQHPFQWHQDPVGYAKRLGEQVASKWNDMKVLDPYVYFANEMNLHYENGDQYPGNQALYTSPEFYKKYADWVRMTADVIKSRVPEMKLVTPPFAFGHHEDGSPDDDGQPTEGWAGFDYLYETVRDYFDNIICFHSYWGHAGGSERTWLYDPVLSSWYALRWRRVLKLFETRYQLQAKVIIDEAGNFGAADPDFTDQIMYHTQQCLSDPRVLAVTYFLWLDPTNSPGNIANSWVQRVRNLPDHLGRLAAMPDVPVTSEVVEEPPLPAAAEPMVRLLLDDGTVQTMLLEEYLRAVVPAEMPALWPIEAVKAQAIAARSYTQYAIEHPRHPNADICTKPAHCQNYDPAKIHAKSDEALQLTKGIIARSNGQTITGVFSANCGGHTFNNEAVFNGAPVPYLRGVPCPDPGPKNGHGVGLCQHGARALASQGQPYEAIVRHYYTGVTLGPITPPQPGAITGLIADHTGKPAANIRIVLTGESQTVEIVSRADGVYRFDKVPVGTYNLELPDYGIKQSNVAVASGQEAVVNLALPAPVRPTIVADIVRGAGLALLVGDWGKGNVPIRVTPPDGAPMMTITGSKREYGPGGFEVYATKIGTYIVEIEGYRFDVPMNGQFTRLAFRQVAGPVQPSGIIEGVLRDHQNRPVSAWFVQLSGHNVNLTATTTAQGVFAFANLAAGSYTLTVADSPISQTVANNGQERVTLALQLPAPPVSEGWQVDLSQGTGLPLLVGDIGVANGVITITSPSGRRQQVTSGSKPEWGIGGFEVYTNELGNYTVEFFGQRFVIPVQGQFTKALFRKETSSVEPQVRLVSMLLPRSRAEALHAELEADTVTRGLFTMQVVTS